MLFIGVRQILIDKWIELELDIKVTISVDVYVPLSGDQSPGSSVEKTANRRAFWRWLGFFNFYTEVGLESAKFISW